jgi:hypothetical protein
MDDAEVADDVRQQHLGHAAGCVVVRVVTHRAGDAGVIDQHVQAPLGLLDAAGGVTDRLIGGHVQFQEPRAGGHGGGPSALAAAGGEIHAVPGPGQAPGRLQTDALIGAGDQRDGYARRFCAHSRPPSFG